MAHKPRDLVHFKFIATFDARPENHLHVVSMLVCGFAGSDCTAMRSMHLLMYLTNRGTVSDNQGLGGGCTTNSGVDVVAQDSPIISVL